MHRDKYLFFLKDQLSDVIKVLFCISIKYLSIFFYYKQLFLAFPSFTSFKSI